MERYRGRGALSNPPPRYLEGRTEGVDDGWYRGELPDSIATQVRPEPARSIITRNDSPDIAFEQSINPYRGCEHGCPYCVAGDTPILMADGTPRPIAQLRRPCPPGGTRMCGAQRLEQGVVVQPLAGRIDKGCVLGRMPSGQLGGIEEGRVAGKVGAHPVRRAVRPGGARGQDLPDGEAGFRQPIDERAAPSPERRVQRPQM